MAYGPTDTKKSSHNIGSMIGAGAVSRAVSQQAIRKAQKGQSAAKKAKRRRALEIIKKRKKTAKGGMDIETNIPGY